MSKITLGVVLAFLAFFFLWGHIWTWGHLGLGGIVGWYARSAWYWWKGKQALKHQHPASGSYCHICGAGPGKPCDSGLHS